MNLVVICPGELYTRRPLQTPPPLRNSVDVGHTVTDGAEFNKAKKIHFQRKEARVRLQTRLCRTHQT